VLPKEAKQHHKKSTLKQPVARLPSRLAAIY